MNAIITHAHKQKLCAMRFLCILILSSAMTDGRVHVVWWMVDGVKFYTPR